MTKRPPAQAPEKDIDERREQPSGGRVGEKDGQPTPDEKVREASKESFPASDPPSFVGGGTSPSNPPGKRRSKEEEKERDEADGDEAE